ncbi:hypothetical protein FRC02_005576, partial [Tulasnella sp. 418]
DQPSLLSFEAINDSGTTLEPANTVNYYVPKEWRKPVVTKSKEELIQIARQAIEFAARHRNASYPKMDELNIFNSAVAIFDRLTGSTLRVNGVFWQGCSSTTTLCYLLDGWYDLFHVPRFYLNASYAQPSNSSTHITLTSGMIISQEVSTTGQL